MSTPWNDPLESPLGAAPVTSRGPEGDLLFWLKDLLANASRFGSPLGSITPASGPPAAFAPPRQGGYDLTSYFDAVADPAQNPVLRGLGIGKAAPTFSSPHDTAAVLDPSGGVPVAPPTAAPPGTAAPAPGGRTLPEGWVDIGDGWSMNDVSGLVRDAQGRLWTKDGRPVGHDPDPKPQPTDMRGFGQNLNLEQQLQLLGAKAAEDEKERALKREQVQLENQTLAAIERIRADTKLAEKEKDVQIQRIASDAVLQAERIKGEAGTRQTQIKADADAFIADLDARTKGKEIAGRLFETLLTTASAEKTARTKAAVDFFGQLAALAPQQNLVNAFHILRGQAPPPSLAQQAIPQLGAIMGLGGGQMDAITSASGINNANMAPFLQELLGVQATPVGG